VLHKAENEAEAKTYKAEPTKFWAVWPRGHIVQCSIVLSARSTASRTGLALQ